MTTYRQAGVDRDLGDLCSEIAYSEAKKTFAGRAGMIGEPLKMDGGFTGALDMKDFLLVQNEDGVGTKMEVAIRMKKFDTLGFDLVAMVADDAICVGAEVISITNTIDADSLDKNVVQGLMQGLGMACLQEKIVVPGGEIAELKGHVNGYTWNATAVGIVDKKKFIKGEGIKVGDKIIGLVSPNYRSNGFTLLRAVLKKAYGENWHTAKFGAKTWGEVALDPCVIYHSAVLSLIGRFGEPGLVKLKGLAHITGGGLVENIPRVLPETLTARLDAAAWTMPPLFGWLQKEGNVSSQEMHRVFNCGIGMVVIVSPDQAATAEALLRDAGETVSRIGTIRRRLDGEPQTQVF